MRTGRPKATISLGEAERTGLETIAKSAPWPGASRPGDLGVGGWDDQPRDDESISSESGKHQSVAVTLPRSWLGGTVRGSPARPPANTQR